MSLMAVGVGVRQIETIQCIISHIPTECVKYAATRSSVFFFFGLQFSRQRRQKKNYVAAVPAPAIPLPGSSLQITDSRSVGDGLFYHPAQVTDITLVPNEASPLATPRQADFLCRLHPILALHSSCCVIALARGNAVYV